MKPSILAVRLITKFEGLELKAYVCPAGKATIGYGTTVYPNGYPVKVGETCTKEQAETYLLRDLDRRSAAIGELGVNQNQYDAIISFVYNVGVGNWNNSTLRRKVKMNPNDPTIAAEFTKWDGVIRNGKKVVLPGLTRRRRAEAELYFKK